MRGPWTVLLALALLGCPAKKGGDETRPPTANAPTNTSVQPRPGDPVAVGSLRNPVVAAPYAIIVPADGDAEAVRATIEAALHARGYAIALPKPKPSDRHALVAVGVPADVGFVVDALQYFGRGLGEADVAGITAATEAVMFATFGPADALASVQHDGAAIAHAAAGKGWIVDAATAETFSPAAFATQRPPTFPIDVRKLIVVHAVREGDGTLVFLETFGLERLGVPELYMRHVPQAYAEAMLLVLNAAAQTLVERGSVTAPGELAVDVAALTDAGWRSHVAALRDNGGSGKITFSATWSRGDSDGVLIELALPGGADTEKMHAAIAGFVGSTLPPPVYAPDDDAELLAASARAKKELAAIAKQCAKGIPETESLLVKAPFDTSEGVEFMWVDVQVCKGDRFDGVLLSQPHGESSLRPGSKVEVSLEDAYDYEYTHADKTTTGNETTKILLERQRDGTHRTNGFEG